MAAWLYNHRSKKFWTYDDILSISLKAHYVDAYNLRGLMFWEITSDDTLGSLVNTIFNKNMPDFTDFEQKDDNVTPSIKIIEPNDSYYIVEGSNVNIKTRTSDMDGKVVKVEFFVDGISVGYNRIAPFNWVWFNASSGKHEIKAIATDNNGGTTISPPVQIKVMSK